MENIHPRTKLSALWLFILLNIIFRDIHQMALKSHLEMLMTGVYNGTVVTEGLMLIGGFLVEIPIAMVLFSLLLKRKFNRPINIGAALATTAVILFTPPSDWDDTFHLIIEMAAMGWILRTAWRWQKDKQVATIPPERSNPEMNHF